MVPPRSLVACREDVCAEGTTTLVPDTVRADSGTNGATRSASGPRDGKSGNSMPGNQGRTRYDGEPLPVSACGPCFKTCERSRAGTLTHGVTASASPGGD